MRGGKDSFRFLREKDSRQVFYIVTFGQGCFTQRNFIFASFFFFFLPKIAKLRNVKYHMNPLDCELLDERNNVLFTFSILRVWLSAWHNKHSPRAAKREWRKKNTYRQT